MLLDEHGRVRPDLRLDEVSVPESIRLVLGQRLGRLAASTREVLVAAAVTGRVFASELVGEVAERWPGPAGRCLRRSGASQAHHVRQNRWRAHVQPRADPPDAAVRRLCDRA